ncbi:MAG: Na+-transporting NADH:ubiquinone oxidoreductase subunit C [Maribacter sp.]
MHSTKYIYLFTVAMTVIVAFILAGLFTVLKPIHQANEAIFNKKAVLSAVNPNANDLSDEEVVAAFASVTQIVLDYTGNELEPAKVKELRNYKDKEGKAEHLDLAKEKKREDKDRLHPLYIFKEGGKNVYVTAVRGNGLWDEIWGYIALADDYSTIVGTSFDHKGETPGLGAEIKDNPMFPKSFKGKKIFNEEGKFVSVLVKKGGADKTDLYAVDGISGATVTADGVTDMLAEGLQFYMPYIEAQKK